MKRGVAPVIIILIILAGILMVITGGIVSVKYRDKNNTSSIKNTLHELPTPINYTCQIPWGGATNEAKALNEFITIGDCGIVKKYNSEGIKICETWRAYPSFNYDNATNKRLCYKSLGLYSNNPVFCNLIEELLYKNDCYQRIAVRTKNLSVCDGIIEDLIQGSGGPELPRGKEECYVGVASETNNLSICEKISNQFWRDDCYEKIAFKRLDLSLCNNIQALQTKSKCSYEIVDEQNALSNEFCQTLEDSGWKAHCISIFKNCGASGECIDKGLIPEFNK